MTRRFALVSCFIALALIATPACSSKSTSGGSSGASKITTAPVNSTTDVGAIRGKTNRAAVATDLRTAITSAEAAGTMSAGGQQDPQAIYQQAVRQIAEKYGITESDVEDIARQYGINP